MKTQKALLTLPSEKRPSEGVLFLISALVFLRSAHAHYALKRATHAPRRSRQEPKNQNQTPAHESKQPHKPDGEATIPGRANFNDAPIIAVAESPAKNH